MLRCGFKGQRRGELWPGDIWHVGRTVFVLALLCWLIGCSPPRGVYHTVKPGQTLYRIGRAYKVDAGHLARINGIREPSQLKVGKRLFIPGARNPKYVPATVSSAKLSRRPSSAQKAPKVAPFPRSRASASRRQPPAVKPSVKKHACC